MKRTIKIMALTALVVIGCAGCKDKNKDAAISNQKFTIRTQQVSAQDVEQVYEYTATVEAEAVNNIAPLTGGRIDKIYVEVGDRVSKGKVLVQMNENSLKQAKVQLDNLKASFNRIDELYKVGGTSKADWDAMKTQLDVAQTTYDNLLENTRLVSPINGVVSARNYDSGDLYGGLPVVTIQQINPVKMKINLSESLFQKVKVGMSVSVKVDAYGDEEFKGRISLIYPTIDGATHTFPVEVQLPNANSRVRPGMYARVTVNFGTSHHVVVPDEAIFRQQGSGNRYVYVYKDGKVSFNQVEIGRHLDKAYELLSGNVQDGDMVATTGLARLKDGLEVNVENK
ncbi:MAG: efflux RND transporter periplasmic adaptor subunit [Bacteroidales bacterium]|nr:efflux RND transporter periplasmic adaptor subunit [Bacteroidales bacterium]